MVNGHTNTHNPLTGGGHSKLTNSLSDAPSYTLFYYRIAARSWAKQQEGRAHNNLYNDTIKM